MRSLQYSRSVVSSSLKILSRCSAFLRLQTYLNSSPDNFPATQLTSTNNKPSLLGRPPLLLGSPRSYLRACTLVILAPGQLIYPLLLLPHLLVGEVGLNINMCYTHPGQVRTFYSDETVLPATAGCRRTWSRCSADTCPSWR